jgi:hypothetical protein
MFTNNDHFTTVMSAFGSHIPSPEISGTSKWKANSLQSQREWSESLHFGYARWNLQGPIRWRFMKQTSSTTVQKKSVLFSNILLLEEGKIVRLFGLLCIPGVRVTMTFVIVKEQD